jgi:20S proteasome alpha/beta subunit
MTAIVGALCEDRRAAVLAADRLEGYGPFEAETDTSKMIQISDSVVVGCSYSDQVGRDVGLRIRETLAGNKRSVGAIAKIVHEYLGSAMHDFREGAIQRRFGVGYEGFRQMVVQAQNQLLLQQITNELGGATFAVQILVAGLEGGRMKLFTVLPSGINSFDSRGTAGVGSGGDYATISLIHRQFRPSMKLADAIFAVYEAKRAAEIAQGVGHATDLVILRADREAQWLDEAELSELEAIRETKKPRQLSDDEAERINHIAAKTRSRGAGAAAYRAGRRAASAPRAQSRRRRGQQDPKARQ